jgi:hypothetical protein
MGHLSDPLNTFWQIFAKPVASGSFTAQTVALAVGTDGGILLGSNDAPTIELAARPSVKLAFTPVLELTGKSLASWTPVAPLTNSISALDQHQGSTVAIIGPRSGPTLVESAHPGANWHTLVTLGRLQHSASLSGCAPSAMTAAAFDSDGDPVVGLACTKSSMFGLYRLRGGSWQQMSTGKTMVPGMSSVLYLTSNHGTLTGIVCVALRGQEHLYTISIGTGTMEISSLGVIHGPLLTTGMGATPGGGAWITYTKSPRVVSGFVTLSPNATPLTIPNIDSRVVTLSVASNGTINALSLGSSGDALQTASLTNSPTRTWTKAKLTQLAIPYGSSG